MGSYFPKVLGVNKEKIMQSHSKEKINPSSSDVNEPKFSWLEPNRAKLFRAELEPKFQIRFSSRAELEPEKIEPFRARAKIELT